MRRSGFKRKSYSEARDALREKQGKRPSCFGARKALKAGRKTKAWNAERRKLKADSERNNRTTCELRGVIPHDCTVDNFLGYAHAAKRRKLSSEDLSHAILICNNVHDIIERWSPEDMKWIVDEMIERRTTCESTAQLAVA